MESSSAVISNVQRFSTEDGPGIRTTVFFKGCPLHCPWCHNPEGLSRRPQLVFRSVRCIGCEECKKACPIGAPLPGTDDKCTVCGKCAEACPTLAREIIGRSVTPEELAEEVLRDRVFFGKDGGVTASGGEAALWPDFVSKFFQFLRSEGVHTALDTSGAVPADRFIELVRGTDLVLFDLKIFDEDRHLKIIGAPLKNVLDNLSRLDKSGVPLWVRFPIVPGYTDDNENINALADILQKMKGLERVDLLPFHQLGRNKWSELGMKYTLGNLEPPSDADVEKIRDFLIESGLPVGGGQ